MVVGETGTEVDVGAVPAKKAKKGEGAGSFEAKFKQPGTKPVQVWEGKYASALKSNGCGGNGGRKWPKNWREREVATAELDRILGRQVLAQLAAKNAQEAGQFSPAGESAWGADAGSRQGSAENTAEGDSMEEEEEEEEEVSGEEEKSAGEGAGEEGGEGDKEGEGVKTTTPGSWLFVVLFYRLLFPRGFLSTVGSRSPDGWDQIPRWAGGWACTRHPGVLGSIPKRENRAPPCVKVPGSSRVPSLVCGGQPSPHKPRLVVSHSTCPPLSSSPHAYSFVSGTPVINTHI
jgi:hypothetical protein